MSPRIVAGEAKGRRLAVPPAGTRPTSDRAREALFSTLAALVELPGARVLDLYAGTGAVGLEALSRGAAAAVFVESHRGALTVLQRNIEVSGLPGATVRARVVAGYLGAAAVADGPFDVVFADPPYALAAAALDRVLAGLTQDGTLAEGAVLAVERSARTAGPTWPDGIEALRERRYGEGVLWYGRRR